MKELLNRLLAIDQEGQDMIATAMAEAETIEKEASNNARERVDAARARATALIATMQATHQNEVDRLVREAERERTRAIQAIDREAAGRWARAVQAGKQAMQDWLERGGMDQ